MLVLAEPAVGFRLRVRQDAGQYLKLKARGSTRIEVQDLRQKAEGKKENIHRSDAEVAEFINLFSNQKTATRTEKQMQRLLGEKTTFLYLPVSLGNYKRLFSAVPAALRCDRIN